MPEGADWIVILLVLVVLFGGSQIPKLARSLGQAQKEFKTGLKEGAEPDPEPVEKPVSQLPTAAAPVVAPAPTPTPVVSETPVKSDGADNLT